jgi:hypothetical protein
MNNPIARGHRVATAILFLFGAIGVALYINLPSTESLTELNVYDIVEEYQSGEPTTYEYITTVHGMERGRNPYELFALENNGAKLREWAVIDESNGVLVIATLWELEGEKIE